jgi:hypothetical protein
MPSWLSLDVSSTPAFDVVVKNNNTKGQALLNRGKTIMAAVQDS